MPEMIMTKLFWVKLDYFSPCTVFGEEKHAIESFFWYLKEWTEKKQYEHGSPTLCLFFVTSLTNYLFFSRHSNYRRKQKLKNCQKVYETFSENQTYLMFIYSKKLEAERKMNIRVEDTGRIRLAQQKKSRRKKTNKKLVFLAKTFRPSFRLISRCFWNNEDERNYIHQPLKKIKKGLCWFPTSYCLIKGGEMTVKVEILRNFWSRRIKN